MNTRIPLRPEGGQRPAAVVETHISTVFLVGDRAFKLKKPLQTAFLDWRTPDQRRRACRQEVALNRRISPDVYLGVLDVVDDAGVFRDALVAMRRMPAERSLSALVAAGADLDPVLRDLARTLGDFHARCRRGADCDAAAGPDAVARLWGDNLDELGALAAGAGIAPAVLDWIREASARYVRGRRRLIEERIAAGRACDGHGDLLADDVFVLDDGVRVLDCLEFDPRFRYGDVLADVAFLAMDLERLGAPDAAGVLLRWYRDFSGDSWPASLAHHWIAYRALVRAKVACLRASQTGREATERPEDLLRLCRDHLERATVRFVLVGGPPGTGKTTLAAGLAEEEGLVRLSTDELRREGGGTGSPPGPAPAYGAGRYRPERVDAVYADLLERAEACLERGLGVVADATWGSAAWRARALDVADRTGAVATELRCTLERGEADRRIRRRLGERTTISEATPLIAHRLADAEDPWPTAAAVDTSGPPASTLGAARRLLRQGCRAGSGPGGGAQGRAGAGSGGG